MNGYEGRAYANEPQATGTGEHKSALPGELEQGTQTPAEAVDFTPTPSRTTSPLRVGKSTPSKPLSSGKGASRTTALTNGIDASVAHNVDPSEVIDSLHASSTRIVEHTSLSKSTVYDSRLHSSPSSPFPGRSLSPRHPSAAPAAPDGSRGKDMSESGPHSGSSSGPSRPNPARRQQQQPQQQQQQQQQRGLQPYGYYTSPPPSEPGFARNPPSVSSQGAHPSFAHTQQPATVQRPTGFVGQYTVSPSPSSLYPQHQVQHQYAYPQLNIPGIPPLPHTHSHTPPEFYSVGHSASPSQLPLYAPPFHSTVSQEHAPTPALPFDYDRTGSAGRSPTTGASSPYSQQQPFATFGFHPTMTATPQFTHSHSPYSSPFPAQQAQHTQRPQYPPSYAYMTRTSPNTPEDSSQSQQHQPSTAWWYIPPHGASPSGHYTSMYYVDAYGNPSNSGPSPGPPRMSSPTSRPMHTSLFSRPDPTISSGSGPSATTGGAQRQNEESNRSEAAISSSQGRPSPSLIVLGESVSDRGTQQQAQSRQSARRSYLPNPPVQRSEWVMWVGNVPSDASHDELWRFFTRPLAPSMPLPIDVHSASRQQQQHPQLPAGLLSPSGSSSASDANPDDVSGVQSVFLIARSNCAFVNFVDEAHLAAAVQRSNGIPLRPGDMRCPRLVCRVRGKEEDLKAGVGAQRGTGIHTRWVREQRERERQDLKKEGGLTDTETSTSEPPGTPSSAVVTDSGTDASTQSSGRRAPQHSSSSGSTTSGFLARYFPKRFFILKSLTQYDLDLSVEKGLWATQSHNETVLNQAFRSSSDVYLIFSVNKSGEFYGYARMAGPIGKATADRVSWASRTDSGHSQHSHSPAASFASSVAGKGSQVNEIIPEENESSSPEEKEIDTSKGKERESDKENHPLMLFSPSEHRLAENSPQPVTPATQKRLTTAQEAGSGKVPLVEESSSAPPPNLRSRNPLPQSAPSGRPRSPTSAPAVMGALDRRAIDHRVEGLSSETLDPRLLRHHPPELQLDPEAPFRAVRHEPRSSGEQHTTEDVDRIKRRDTLNTSRELNGEPQQLPDARSASQAERGDHSAQWGSPFKIQWIKTDRLPFSRTRHLRNPWNHEREVKVSRDGTELEPSVGQALLDEWDKEEPSPPPQPPSASGGDGGVGGRRGSHYRRMQSQAQVSTVLESVPGSGPGSPQPRQQKNRLR